MSLSRKRKKELTRLRRSANELWENQQVVLDHAAHVARETSRQLGALGREEVLPRVQRKYEKYILPSAQQAGLFARNTGERIERDVLPAVGRTLGSVLAIGDVAREARIKKALARINPHFDPQPVKKGGAGKFFVITTVLALAGAIGYALWQTFRADDELWVADESDFPSNQ